MVALLYEVIDYFSIGISHINPTASHRNVLVIWLY